MEGGFPQKRGVPTLEETMGECICKKKLVSLYSMSHSLRCELFVTLKVIFVWKRLVWIKLSYKIKYYFVLFI